MNGKFIDNIIEGDKTFTFICNRNKKRYTFFKEDLTWYGTCENSNKFRPDVDCIIDDLFSNNITDLKFVCNKKINK